jgi:hypothetical protein
MSGLDRAALLVAGLVLSGCGAITPNSSVRHQAPAPAKWKKSVKIQQEQAARFQREHPDADGCIKRNAATFKQSYSGQLRELCLSVEENP